MRISDWSSDVCSSDLGRFVLTTPQGRLTARQVIVATNGYTEDDRLPALSGRLMPAQSSIIVTRPLSPAEQEAQGWTSTVTRSEEHTSELQSLMRISYAVFCLKKKKKTKKKTI